ncbi:MAG: carbohydrate kinase [Clostridiales bacterium]|nr:carbohydrate kinase [Clostridiales bacterium]
MMILSYDIGTTGVKTCLFRMGGEGPDVASIVMEDASSESYSLSVLPNGGVEQNPHEWWEAMCETTRRLVSRNPVAYSQIAGISFCAQAQSVVLLDESARALRPSMSYMDQRSGGVRRAHAGGGPKVAGVGLPFLLQSLYHTGVVAGSDKDPVWKYLWVKENEPEIFSKAHKWLDVKDALIARMTGEFSMSRDSAFATLLMDKNAKTPEFSSALMKRLGVLPEHMPKIVESTTKVGVLLDEPAAQLGLSPGIPVFSGGSDAALIGVGAGCVRPGMTHVYMGTSGWVSTVTDKNIVDTNAMIASVVGVQPGLYNYFAELETAGKCLEWVRDHLALDEINIYLEKHHVAEDASSEYKSLYDYMSKVISETPAGCGGVIFTPWLHGNRCPFEDANARGIFFNIGLETGKTELIRAVVEGVCYHMRWFLETIRKKLNTGDRVRFVGGGALSPVTAGILADVLQIPVETVSEPQNVGSVGAALAVAVGLGRIADLKDAENLIKPDRVFMPDSDARAVHDKNYAAFIELYAANKKLFRHLNQIR